MPPMFRLLPGLPPYGEPARSIPPEWGRFGREGTVVEFARSDGFCWIANFQPGLGGVEQVVGHPNGHDIVVFASGDMWIVNPDAATAECVLCAIHALWQVRNPDGFVLDRQGLAFARLGPPGILWHTRRLSWDGFADVQLNEKQLAGRGWAPGDHWHDFEVDLATGASKGGAYPRDLDAQWEQLA